MGLLVDGFLWEGDFYVVSENLLIKLCIVQPPLI